MDAANLKTLKTNIAATIRHMKREGTVGASLECLKACTHTVGLTCPVPQYHAEFDAVASEVAKRLKFNAYA